MLKLAVIHNPNARRNLKHPDMVGIFRDILGKVGTYYVTESLSHMRDIAREIRKKDVDIIAINGGDGSLQQTITAIINSCGDKKLPAIAILRGGNMNTIAKVVGVRARAETFLRYVVAKVQAGVHFEYKEQKIMKINDQYGFIFGYGLIPNFLEAYYNMGGGPWSAVKVLIRGIISTIFNSRYIKELTRRFNAVVSIDGLTQARGQYNAILAGTVDDIGLGFRFLYRAYERGGYFHFRVSQLSAIEYVFYLLKFYFGWRVKNRKVGDCVTRHVVINTDEPQLITIDGENQYLGNEVTLEPGPTIRFVLF